MLHKYRKIALIEAEQYRGTVKQQRKYGILRIQKSLLIAPKDYLITIDGLTRGWIDANNTSKISNAQ